MQWMTMTSVVPCHALHAPQHAAATPFEPLYHSNNFLRPSCRSRLNITGIGISRYAEFYPPTDRFGAYSDQHGVRPSVDASLLFP